MHTVDVALVCVAALVVVSLVMIVSRQRYLLRSAGAFPLAVRGRGQRWMYGIARYVGGELRWYRSLGFATRPSRVLRRSELAMVSRRAPTDSELQAMPSTAVIVECRDGPTAVVLALGGSAFTGFVSWLESSAPMT
jgi:hypothetical protein